MAFQPENWLGHAVPDLLADLQKIPAEELWPQGQVELHGTDDTTEPLTARPGNMMVPTVPDCDLESDHPPVEVPGVALEKYLGGGGQGWVYAGRVRATGKIVAVKVLRKEYVAAHGRAAREAILCARVRHPNILRVFEAQPAGSFFVVLMEMIRGAELHDVPLSADQLRRCLAQIADALIALGKGQIVHCDIKPSNILLRQKTGAPVLVDFGVACDLSLGEDSRTLFGTPYYLPPEALRHDKPTPAWDAYGLGVTAANVLGCKQSFDSLTDVLTAKQSGAFDRQLARDLARVPDQTLAGWIKELVHADQGRRLQAVKQAVHWN